MDLDEVIYEIKDSIRMYKSGRVDRFKSNGSAFVPPSTDSVTGISFKDVTISRGISARVYLPKLEPNKKVPVLVYYHGGAFCLGTAFEPPWHDYVAALAYKANIIVVSVEYRLGPEHPIPIPYEDSYAALDWVVSHANGGPEPWLVNHGDFDRLFVSGESAGGNIAHHVAIYGGKKIHGLVLIHPYFLSSSKVESEEFDAVLNKNLVDIWEIVSPKSKDLNDPWINPLAEGASPLNELGCKRVLVMIGGMDVLRDRGRAYYERLKESGWKGDVEIYEAAGERHCFYFSKPESEPALEQDQIIINFLNKI